MHEVPSCSAAGCEVMERTLTKQLVHWEGWENLLQSKAMQSRLLLVEGGNQVAAGFVRHHCSRKYVWGLFVGG